MKVAIDTTPLQNQSASRGIGMYTKHLVKYLKNIPSLEIIEHQQGELPEDVELIHYPFFDLYFRTLPLRKPLPTIVTIHDLTPLVLDDLYPTGIKGKLNFMVQKRSLSSVNAIITDSQSSRHDIVKFLGIPAQKIHPILLAPQDGLDQDVSSEKLHQVVKKFNLPHHFILYVGDINPNKNIRGLVAASQQISVPLVIVGKQAVMPDFDHKHTETQDLKWLQQTSKKSKNIIRTGFVQFDELGALYKLADVYCQPSLYEGFGLPVLEALSMGCPVVCPKHSSLIEVGGPAVVYAGPNPDKLAKALKFVIDLTESNRQRLILEGKKHAETFSWQKTAQQTYHVYLDVLKKQLNPR